jgi:hypothetical protein
LHLVQPKKKKAKKGAKGKKKKKVAINLAASTRHLDKVL